MNIAVIYSSMTGHSKKIAKAVAQHLGVTANNVKDNPQLKDVDLLFIAGGIYGGACNTKLVKYAEGIKGENVKNAAFITSCASNESKQEKVREILSSNGVKVLDKEYICLGSFLFMKMGHPNKEEVQGAVKFAEDITKEYSK